MITGQLKSRIDKLWTEFWTGGITNPLTVIEQISFLMFIRLLDINESRREKQAARSGKPFKGTFSKSQQHLRWQNLMQLGGEAMLKTVRDEVFPHFREIAGTDSTFGKYMADAQLMVQKPSLLVSAMSMINDLPLDKTDIKGDLYEYLLSKLTTAGINGQFRTPRHMIRLMVDLLAPKATDTIADPACGTGGFLITVMDYLLEHNTSPDGFVEVGENGEAAHIPTGDLLEPYRKHIQSDMFYGFDFDVTMLRIAAMNMMLHGVENPNVEYADTLSKAFGDRREVVDRFDMILANPPFKGSLDADDVHSSLTGKVKTKKTELLFLVLMLRMLKLGGRCAVIVPAGVLDASTPQHEVLRRHLVEEHQLDAIISLPHSTFKPYASVATAILLFTKGGRTGRVWAYDIEQDGYSQDGVRERIELSDLPDVREQWAKRNRDDYKSVPRKHGWFDVRAIRDNGYSLAPKQYIALPPNKRKYPDIAIRGLCSIRKGTVGAMQSEPGPYPFVSTAAELGSHTSFQFEGDSVCIPLVSSTGHGHASMKRVTFISGQFAAATIVAVLQVNDPKVLNPKYLYYLLQAFKDELLVPLMKGAANVSLSVAKIGSLRVPVPPIAEQEKLIADMERIRAESEQLNARLSQLNSEQDYHLSTFRTRFFESKEPQVSSVEASSPAA